MEWYAWLCIACAAAFFVMAIVFAVRASSLKKYQAELEKKAASDKVVVKDGVRYTEREDEGAVTHNEGDVVLSVGKPLTAAKNGKLLPGKYKVLSASEEKVFNLRVGGMVREYTHGDEIVLGDGDEITAVSHTVILR